MRQNITDKNERRKKQRPSSSRAKYAVGIGAGAAAAAVAAFLLFGTEKPVSPPSPSDTAASVPTSAPTEAIHIGVTAPPWDFSSGQGDTFRVRENEPVTEEDENSPVTGPLGKFMLSLTPDEILFAPDENIYDDPVHSADGRFFSVTLHVDGKTIELVTQPTSVSSVLERAEVSLGKDDEIDCKLNSPVSDGMSVNIHRITYKTETKTEAIDYETQYIDTYYLDKGKTQLVSSGSKGERKLVYTVKYRDGEKVSTTLDSTTVTKKPVARVYKRGLWEGNTSKFTANGIVCSAGPKAGTYSQVITARTTAYTHTGNNTASGLYPVQGKSVAVAKKYFKTGMLKKYTRLFISGYGFCIVEDSGDTYMENYSGYWIDLFLDTKEQCMKWGMRDNVKVYILN